MRQAAIAATVSAIVFLSSVPPVADAAQTGGGKVEELLSRLKISLPDDLEQNANVKGPLNELAREPCDQSAIKKFATALKEEGYKREAAEALTGFSESCGGHGASLRTAVNIYLGISDYLTAVHIADDLIKLEPHDDNGYFLRAIANEKAGIPQPAIDDYATAIELFADKRSISSASYEGMARNYDKLGQPCEAANAIELWVASDPVNRDTSQSQAIVRQYRSKGACPIATGKEDVFPLGQGTNLTFVSATVNGVKGKFILDTGASYVALNGGFAAKAQIATDSKSHAVIATANGITGARRGKASVMQLKSLSANDVAVIIPAEAGGIFAPGADGLLGMSFLSRFDMRIEDNQVRLRGKATGLATSSIPEREDPPPPNKGKPQVKASSSKKPDAKPKPKSGSIFPW